MRILLSSTGSRGDVQPFLVLAAALQKQGHEVKVAAPVDYSALAHELQIPFAPIQGDIQSLLQSEGGRKMLNSGSNPFAMMSGIKKMIQPIIEETGRVIRENAEDANLIISHYSGSMFTQTISEKLQIPYLPVMLVPLLETAEHPSVLFPPLPLNWAWLNRLTGIAIPRIFWMLFGSALNENRRNILGMPDTSFGEYYNKLRQTPILMAYSSLLAPKPKDWPATIHETGFWYQDSGLSSPELETFLAHGDAPIYFGFGSMNTENPKQTGETILEALDLASKRLGRQLRAVLLKGWSGLNLDELPAHVLMLESVPHHLLFPRCAAIVHHGGVGTTASALRAGVPNLVIPFMADQPFWGRRIAELGLGASPIPLKKLQAETLADALVQMLSDKSMQQNACDFGQKLAAENGLGKAIDYIHRFRKN